MIKHINILNRIFNTPLLIEQSKLDIISSNIGLKLLNNESILAGVATPTNKSVKSSNPKVAVIKVFDSLVAKGGAGESGFTSYEDITSSINSAINAGASKIGFYIDSPGGEANGAFALTDFIHSIPAKYGVETFSFSDGYMTSGAYAIASATQKIYVTDSTHAGSIAAISALVDMTEADKQDGYQYHIIRSMDGKAIYNPHEKLTEEVIAKQTESLIAIGNLFADKVSTYRPGLTKEKITELNGATIFGSKLLKIGLADKIVTSLNDVISIETKVSNKSQPIGNTMTLEELKAKLDATETELKTLKSSVESSVVAAVKEERIRCSEIYNIGATLHIPVSNIKSRIERGTSLDEVKESFTELAEAYGNKTAINTSADAIPTTVNPDSNLKVIDIDGVKINTADIVAFAKGAK